MSTPTFLPAFDPTLLVTAAVKDDGAFTRSDGVVNTNQVLGNVNRIADYSTNDARRTADAHMIDTRRNTDQILQNENRIGDYY